MFFMAVRAVSICAWNLTDFSLIWEVRAAIMPKTLATIMAHMRVLKEEKANSAVVAGTMSEILKSMAE